MTPVEVALQDDLRYRSSARCVRSSCPAYGKRMRLELGQDDNGRHGLEAEALCDDCGGRLISPRTPVAAARHSETVARVLRHRLEGWTVPLRIDRDPFPVGDLAEVNA